MDPQRQQTLWAVALENYQAAVCRTRYMQGMVRGPLQGKGKKAFWETVKKRCNTKMERQVYGDWNEPKRRYGRLQKRVKNPRN